MATPIPRKLAFSPLEGSPRAVSLVLGVPPPALFVRHCRVGNDSLVLFPSPPPVGPNGQAVNARANGEEDIVEPELLFTDNDMNFVRLWGVPSDSE